MMRPDATPVFRALAALRRRRLARLDAAATQRRTLLGLLRRAEHTRFGRDHGFTGIADVAEFRAAVPLRRYEQFWADYWQPAFPRPVDVSWPGLIRYFAVSSGTTAGRTKYLPLTDAMRRSNVRAGFDVVAHHLGARPASRMFAGRSLMLGGSTALVEEAPGIFSGDLSGIAAKTLPFWARGFSFPGPELALLADWEAKLERLARESLDQPIRVLTGTPSWLLILLERVRELRRAAGGDERPYPDLDLLIHGGCASTATAVASRRCWPGPRPRCARSIRPARASSPRPTAARARGCGSISTMGSSSSSCRWPNSTGRSRPATGSPMPRPGSTMPWS